jgi:hypothetical protein
MSNPNDPYVERTVVEEPAVRREVEPSRSGGNSAGWWIAALVALAAVVGLFMIMGNDNAQDLQAAREAGRTEAVVDSASTDAQRAATAASDAARSASASMAGAASSAGQAADSAADRAQQAATSAGDAASDAAASVGNEAAQ